MYQVVYRATDLLPSINLQAGGTTVINMPPSATMENKPISLSPVTVGQLIGHPDEFLSVGNAVAVSPATEPLLYFRFPSVLVIRHIAMTWVYKVSVLYVYILYLCVLLASPSKYRIRSYILSLSQESHHSGLSSPHPLPNSYSAHLTR